MQPDISIVTPWLDHPEFIEDYERAVTGPGVDVIVVDNGSAAGHAEAIRAMIGRLGGKYLRNEENRWFAAANNQGLAVATGQIIVFLNNDIAGDPGWLEGVRQDVAPGSLVGPTVRQTSIEQKTIAYLEGWCIAGHRQVWDRLRGWDAHAFKMPYWEDAELSIRASRAGIRMAQAAWPLTHKKNGTSGYVPGILYGFEQNRQTLAGRMRGAVAVPAPDISGPLEPLMNYLQTGRLPQAEQAYREAVEHQPNNARHWTYYGQALRMSGRFEAAIAAQNRAKALEPALTADACREIALSFEGMGKREEAVAAFEELVRLLPDSLDARLRLAMSLNIAGRYTQAADTARAAIALSPSSAPPHVQLSNALLRQGQNADAAAVARSALACDAEFAGAHQALGAALRAQGDLADALASYDRALTLDPHNGMVHAQRQELRVQLEKPPD